jgi:hypothetical protein
MSVANPAELRQLLEFIDAVKAQGATDEFVVSLLRQNGWSERRIYQAFTSWYESRTGKMVPNGGGRTEAAKDAFFYLIAFITLGIWAIQLGALVFNAIDRIFPNAALDSVNSFWMIRSMANELASIIVAFPLFLLVSRGIVRGVQRQPERLESPVRKWLTYIALILTASTMIGDAVTFLAYLLRGDLNVRFVLKVLTILVISGGVFAYYLDSLRRDRISSARNRAFAFAALAVVAFGLTLGFVQVGLPAVQRSVSEDARRLYDLSSLAHAMFVRWRQSDSQKSFALPSTIEDLPATGIAGTASLLDPVTRQRYSYYPLHGTAYRLCATFSRPSPAEVPHKWKHPAGSYCFALDASEDVPLMQKEW